jgi:hypothetical protein
MEALEKGFSGIHGDELYRSYFDAIPAYQRPTRRRKERPPVPTSHIFEGPRRKAASFERVRLAPRGEEDIPTESLYDILVHNKRGIKYIPSLTTKEGAEYYLDKHNLEDKWNVISGDFDNDEDTPDNVVILDQDKRKRFIDGYGFIPRRYDVLNYKEIQDINKAVKEGTLSKQQAGITKSNLRKYNRTHATAASRAEESINDYINRINLQKQYNVLHKMYLEHYPKEQRTPEREQEYKAKVLTNFPDIGIGAINIFRRALSRKVQELEATGVRFRDKLGLLHTLLVHSIVKYRAQFNFPENIKIIGHDYLSMTDSISKSNLLTTFPDVIQAYRVQ